MATTITTTTFDPSVPTTGAAVSGTDLEIQSALERYERKEEQILEFEAKNEIVSNTSRRVAVIVIVVLGIVLALVAIVAAVIITFQIQNAYNLGPQPPINQSITSTTVLGPTGVAIPQGGLLQTSPGFNYTASWTTDLWLNVTGTTTPFPVWNAGVTGLLPSSQALLQLTSTGKLVVWVPDAPNATVGHIYATISDNPEGPVGVYTLQVTEFDSPGQPNNMGGQIQILDPSQKVIWWRGIPPPSGGS